MNTKILSFDDIPEAAAILKRGGLVCFPTETVYGIGAIANSEEAFTSLCLAKGRRSNQPFTLMCPNLGVAASYCDISAKELAIMKEFMPGEITVIAKARPDLPEYLTLGTGYIGIRVPDSKNVAALIEAVGEPLLVPSANITGMPTSTDFQMTFNAFNGVADAIIKGECEGKKASTIVSFKGGLDPVREGPIPFAKIEEVAKREPLTIALGSDHGGFEYKEAIKEHLEKKGYRVLDEGTHEKASCDYPIYGLAAANDVASKKADLGIVVCTSGEGIMMAANKVKGIRCGIGYDDDAAAKTVEHNNANMISFGQKYMKLEDVLRRVDIFLLSKPSPEEKHHRRVGEIVSAEK